MKISFEEVLSRRYHKSPQSALKSDPGPVLILSDYLDTPENIEKGRELSVVNTDHLMENTPSYAGYFTVEKQYNSNLWFWYFPVEQYDVEKAPLVIWLQGGPGASSLFGLFEELGPFSVEECACDLRENPYSWHQNNSLLFIDNPVGTGFSFTDSEDGYALYITGESYAGKHIPSFAYVIHKRNPTAKLKVNLQGLAIGNGFIDPETMLHYSDYLYQLGFLDDNQADEVRYYENKTMIAFQEQNYTSAFRYFGASLGVFIWRSRMYNLYNYVYENTISIGGAYSKFVQKSEIRKALHVGNTKFTSIGKVYWKLKDDFMKSAKGWLEELLEHYKVMVYSGQMDIICAYPTSISTYRSFNWSKTEDYLKARRRPWYEENTLIGYTKRAGNLLEVFIRNAGHMVPTDQPRRSFLLINSFINDVPFKSKPDEDDYEDYDEDEEEETLRD